MSAPDRLARITAWIAGSGILLVSFLAFDAVSLRPRPTVRAAMPPACPTPSQGEKLILTVELREGLLDITCNTIRPPVRRSK